VLPIFLSTILYSNDVETITVRGKDVIIENLSPTFTDEKASERRQAIEDELFDIFEKYQKVPR